jgi:hypothetical protein
MMMMVVAVMVAVVVLAVVLAVALAVVVVMTDCVALVASRCTRYAPPSHRHLTTEGIFRWCGSSTR